MRFNYISPPVFLEFIIFSRRRAVCIEGYYIPPLVFQIIIMFIESNTPLLFPSEQYTILLFPLEQSTEKREHVV